MFFSQWNIVGEFGETLAGAMNMGLATGTWSQYKTVENHITRCSIFLNKDMSLPFDVEKTMNFIAFLIKERNCSGKTIDCYLSAVRMAHLKMGFDCPHLRQPIVKLILKGRMHQDSLKQKLEQKSARLPVTIPVMRYIKHKLISTSWSFEKCLLVWAVSTTLWNGAMRVHEALARETMLFENTSTLLSEVIAFVKGKVEGADTDILNIKLK